MGKNCIQEVVSSDPSRIVEIVTSRDLDPTWKKKLAKEVKLRKVRSDQIESIVHSSSHQGIAARVKDRPLCSLESVLDSPLILLLDGIEDPQNFGAILRASECFGVGAVITAKNRSVKVTPVVSKVSVGASEIVNHIVVSNLVNTVKKLKENGYWIVASDVEKGAESIDSFSFPEKTAIIMGAEGKGIRRLLKESADFRVYIPMKGKIDSLNVSQATAVFLSKASS